MHHEKRPWFPSHFRYYHGPRKQIKRKFGRGTCRDSSFAPLPPPSSPHLSLSHDVPAPLPFPFLSSPFSCFLSFCASPFPPPSRPYPDQPVGHFSRFPSASRLPEWGGRAEARFPAAAARTEPRPPLPLHPRKVSRRIPGKDPHPPFFLRFMVSTTRNGTSVLSDEGPACAGRWKRPYSSGTAETTSGSGR
jgi:hypothetical protein